MFLRNERALVIDDTLVIADVHVGLTTDFWNSGIRLPSQVPHLVKRLVAMQTRTKTKRLVLLGDIKHAVVGTSYQERQELHEFFSSLHFDHVIVVKGNHDGNIERFVPSTVAVKKSYTFKSFAFTHGHRLIKTTKKHIIIGHSQPHVKLQDEMGSWYIEPVWVRGPLTGDLSGKELIIMPPFNELCGAGIINDGPITGTIAKKLDTQEAHVYLLDGTDLGCIDDLMIR
ncbi:MAG: metallophosphoesterase [Candidatus Aenigmarchaeota archaeon]|nr:metallophosphoesterase [Candidatus Aenigmarchaeota archaeon]